MWIIKTKKLRSYLSWTWKYRRLNNTWYLPSGLVFHLGWKLNSHVSCLRNFNVCIKMTTFLRWESKRRMRQSDALFVGILARGNSVVPSLMIGCCVCLFSALLAVLRRLLKWGISAEMWLLLLPNAHTRRLNVGNEQKISLKYFFRGDLSSNTVDTFHKYTDK